MLNLDALPQVQSILEVAPYTKNQAALPGQVNQYFA